MIAAKVPVARLRDEFLRVRPEYELVASEESFPDQETAWAWQMKHEEFVSAAAWTAPNPGKSAYIFWQDGPWAVMSDPSYTHAGDKEMLAALSASIGTVVSLVVETAGGCAMFGCFQDGRMCRWIDYSDGEATLKGEPLPEEAGIDVSGFYMDEAEAIWQALGLNTFADVDFGERWQAICVIDRTDYSDQFAKWKGKGPSKAPSTPEISSPSRTGSSVTLNIAPATRVPKRPWWRFW